MPQMLRVGLQGGADQRQVLALVAGGDEILVGIAGRVERPLHAVAAERQHEGGRERIDDQDLAGLGRQSDGSQAFARISPDTDSSWPTKARPRMRSSAGAFSPSKRLLL